ncbi:hypothetical protein GQ54DRAFT_308843 [Martensiomyces pterosporus]|nr:hypothetical protein GQ54DRAFT_308843 [Martensiomyces pterosporus]
MCDDKNKNSFYTCTNNKWASLSCADGNECRVVKNNAVCMDPNSPTPSDDGQDDAQESLAPCDTLNATMCDSSHKSKFYTCVDHKWTSMKCDGDNVCVVRNNKAKCLDKATADAPQQPCKIEKATQCAPDNKKIYQVCTDHYWTNSTCANNNHCLFRNGKALCVDKATAEAPQLPCKNDKETQCVSDDKSIFQVCVDKFWTNSTCDKGNVCGMKKGKAICHDPNESIKDVPELPCDKDKATRCVLGNQTLYQVCSNKLWTNLTCDGGNVCRMKSDAVVCVDKHTAEEASSVYSMGTPSAYVPTASRATSMNALYSWGIGALLAAISVAFGASL